MLDAAHAALGPAAVAVISLVGVQLGRAPPRAAPLARAHGRDGVQRGAHHSRGHSVGRHADNAMGERVRKIGVPRTWQAIVGRLLFMGCILWTKGQLSNSECQSRLESGRLRDDQVKSKLFTLVLA